jgi:MerR family transcriptional regulator, thiopeptide resistance regulator
MDTSRELSIGEVAERTGMTQRTLRYYESLGLLQPSRSAAGQRQYDADALDRLYRIRLQRSLGTPLAEVRADVDLRESATRHLAALDGRIAELSRERERVRAVEDRLLHGTRPDDAELLALLEGLGDEPVAVRRLTLLVYRDLDAAHAFLTGVFGFAPGPVERDDSGRPVHAEVHVGDGLVWMHPEHAEARLVSPIEGTSTHCMAVDVDDVDAHHERVRALGAEIDSPPRDMPYGVREYDVRDVEGGLWSFMQPLA